eukprot:m.159480 g.159480  ORF g.159480 m.159480 type:complete len:1802 (+) comp13370_c0_seq2:43-5448(+)
MKGFSVIGLLLWKNFTLARRRPIATLFEIVLPIAFVLILVGIRQSTLQKAKTECEGGCNYPSFSPKDTSYTGLTANCSSWEFVYAPTTADANAIAANVKSNLDTWGMPVVNVSGVASDDAMVDSLLAIPSPCKFGVAMAMDGVDDVSFVIRLDSTPGGYTPGESDQYTSDWLTEFAFPEFRTIGPRGQTESPTMVERLGGAPGYMQYGFANIHHAMLMSLAQWKGSAEAETLLDLLTLQRIPYPQYLRDNFLYAIKFGLPMLLMISLTFSVLTIARNLVREKEQRLKESMKMMGLPNWAHWSAWYLQAFVFLLVTMIINSLICKYGLVLEHSSTSLVFVYFMAFSTATITFCFLVSVFFTNASTGAAAAGIAWFVSYIPYMFVGPNYPTLSYSTKIGTCFISTSGMAMGAQLLSDLESRGDGAQWNSFFDPISVDDPMSIGTVVFVLFGDSLVYFLLAWYIEGVFPGKYGMPKPWYFPFTRWYWFGHAQASSAHEQTPLLSDASSSPKVDPSLFEREPTTLGVGVDIKNLRKVFNKKKVAVRGTHLRMFEGQITALLGHNGAGKTTTISMLTGLFPPSSGTATVNGHDICTDVVGVRESLGICPQHNVLFLPLTVEEHLIFYCKLKGVAKRDIQHEVDEMIEALELVDKRHVAAASLSGGMKRKLSVGVALIGGSKVVILDEPTSGMDPGARRKTWDLLNKYKSGRTILLTTHFLDEADLLGDRIAIMADGVIECCGTSAFLKSKYGEGYHMVCVKKKGCDANVVLSLIQEHVPSAYLEADIGAEATYLLPRSSSSAFAAMFTELEEKKEQLLLLSIGVSLTTMEEVFLKVGERQTTDGDDEHDSTHFGSNGKLRARVDSHSTINGDVHNSVVAVDVGDDDEDIDANDTDMLIERKRSSMKTTEKKKGILSRDDIDLDTSQFTSNLNFGWALKKQQLYAMFVKRLLHSKRSKKTLISQLILPISFVIVALVVAQVGDVQNDSPLRGFDDFSHNYGKNTLMYAMQEGSNDSPAHIPSNNLTASLGATLLTRMAQMTSNDNVQTVLNIATDHRYTFDSMADYALKVQSDDSSLAGFNKYNMIGVEFHPLAGDNVELHGLFNGQAYHTIMESHTLSAGVLLKHFANLTVSAANFPLPRTPAEKAQDQTDSFQGFYISFTILFGMSFLASSFVLFIVAERANKAKHVQFVSGVSEFAYWCAAYIWDMINFMLPTIGCVLVFLAFGVKAYVDERIGYVALLFVLYGLSVIPSMYITSFMFETPSKAYTLLTIVNIVTGLAAMLTVQMLETTNPDIANTLKSVFLFLPNYCFGQALSDIYNNYMSLSIMSSLLPICRQYIHDPSATVDQCCHLVDNFPDKQDLPFQVQCESDFLAMSPPGIGRYLVCMVAQSIVFFIIVLLIEYGVMRRAIAWISGASATVKDIDLENMDQDVRAERMEVQTKMRILENKCSQQLTSVLSSNELAFNNPNAEPCVDAVSEVNAVDDVLVVHDLCKTFKVRKMCATKPKFAVDHLSFAVPRGECFGLLGVNGAGKTTTFRMLTGDETMSRGNAFLAGHNIKTDMASARMNMGYCGQVDSLIDLLTGRELLTMFSRLRGVREENIPALVDVCIRAVMLQKHADKPCGSYSGGNKRKLGTAIALCGPSPVVYLDEPTTGMDPGARRHLWNTLLAATDHGRSLVLTSHSMEECEALCSRLAIMVNGQFKCIGSLQHLKSRFGKGVFVTVTTTAEQLSAVKDHFLSQFDEISVEDEHETQISFMVGSTQRDWAQIFTVMENARGLFDIEDYNVTQTTLEQVFLMFAQHQFDE